MRRPALLPLTVMVSVLGACGYREPVPAFHADDARFGRLHGSREHPPKRDLCRRWTTGVIARDDWATSHVSFPETDVQAACFARVTHAGRDVHVEPPARGCAYPGHATRARLETLAAELEASAARPAAPGGLFSCSLTAAEKTVASRQNARALRAIARSNHDYPYAAVVVPGEGSREQELTSILEFRPADACRGLADGDLRRFGGMPQRSARAADAIRGAVAPVVIVSGGAVHSRLNEALALMYLLVCREHIDSERVILEPCARHTHENLRNSARWIDAMGGRAAYLVTDDGLQSQYFQDFSFFELIMGSADQRSLRDWGYLVGSWRQASIGMNAGFWFTPYRFWAEARDGLGSVTCVDDAD